MELIKENEYLEQHNDVTTSHGDLLSDKKAELEHLRENKVKGEQIRSCIQWLSEGEKPSKTFCKLETKILLKKLSESSKFQLDSIFMTKKNCYTK